MLVVDAANVVGSRPDGWWRDRAGAAGRLIARIETALDRGTLDAPVLVVLEGKAREASTVDSRRATGVVLDCAPGSGDDRIVELVAEAATRGEPVTVVTADRGLIRRVHALGAAVEGPGAFLRRLEDSTPQEHPAEGNPPGGTEGNPPGRTEGNPPGGTEGNPAEGN